MSSIVENIVDSTIVLFLLSCIFAGLMWAAEKERELGIHGMSSERILVRDKLGKKAK